jgi:Ca-activated chloride channel family protein
MNHGRAYEVGENKPNHGVETAPPVSARPRRVWAPSHGAGLRTLAVVSLFAFGLVGGEAKRASAQAADEALAPVALDARSETGATQRLPLVDEAIAVRIDDGHASATYDHVFQNESSSQLEGNYRLSVGEGATATGFSYWNGPTRIVGEIFERDAARQVYEAMTGLRRDPGLLEQAGEGGFSFHVFPIAPGEKKHVEVTTSRWVPLRDGALEYRVRLASPGAKVRVDVRDARGVGAIESPSHAIETEPVSDGVRVRATKAKSAADEGEFVLRIRPKEAALTLRTTTFAAGDGAAFVAVSLRTPPRPAGAPPRAPHDVTLVLDRSGSMGGGAIEAARAAARKLVSRLGASDAVNVIAFDDKVETLFERPKPLTDAVRREVDDYLRRLDSRGGTDIAAALARALAAQTDDARPDLVLFLTDGQSDGPAAIDVAKKDASDTRVFTVGLGDGVDKPLLARIASLKKGRFSFVSDARAIEGELPKIVAELEAPVLTDVHMHAEGVTIDRAYPSSLPDLFSDDELRVFLRMKGASGKIVVEANEGGAPRRFEGIVDAASAAASAEPKTFVGRSWARARVDELLEDEKATDDAEAQHAMDDEIVELGLAYALVTPRTSFLAIPETELTAAAKGAVESMRDRRKKILLANADAAALSRFNMPPGDPVLRVRAPRTARRVTASFPFGLTLDLEWDAFTELWSTRFLVPKDVADGTYEVPVVIEHDDGRIEATRVRYTIDATEPSFELDVRPAPGGVTLRVTSAEPVLEVRATREGVSSSAVALSAGDEPGTFVATLALPPGLHRLRVVVADAARNEMDRSIDVEVQP